MKIAIATTFALAAAQEKKVRSRYNKVLILNLRISDKKLNFHRNFEIF